MYIDVLVGEHCLVLLWCEEVSWKQSFSSTLGVCVSVCVLGRGNFREVVEVTEKSKA